MFEMYTKILETKEIFTLNLDDYSGIDDFEESKGLLWSFRHYLKNNKNDVHVLLRIKKESINDLSNSEIKASNFYNIISDIISNLK